MTNQNSFQDNYFWVHISHCKRRSPFHPWGGQIIQAFYWYRRPKLSEIHVQLFYNSISVVDHNPPLGSLASTLGE